MVGALQLLEFDSSKETDNKLRWLSMVDGAKFQLYIPKWRVPRPWPGTILVGIDVRRRVSEDLCNLTRDEVEANASLVAEPIIATVTRVAEHTQTIRYAPVGDPAFWEIGEPYIPFSLTYGGAKRLRLIVLWELSSRGRF